MFSTTTTAFFALLHVAHQLEISSQIFALLFKETGETNIQGEAPHVLTPYTVNTVEATITKPG